jgi:VWFA-related protein
MSIRFAHLGFSLFAILSPTSGTAQVPQSSTPTATQASPVIRSTTRLVQVRVIVQDGKGDPITDLKSEDFKVLDEGKPQNIAIFSSEAVVPGKLAHPLPNNVFTNRFDLKGQEAGSVTIVLFDALNTSGPDLIYVRKQVLRFLQTLKPEDHVAIYALTTQLLVLHEFTQDTAALVGAVSHFAPKESAAYDASNVEKVNLVDLGGGDVSWLGFQNALNNANAMIGDRYKINRAGITSAAVQAIAAHVAAIPGQKSLIWVSGGFPLQIGTVTIGRTDDDNLGSQGNAPADPRTVAGRNKPQPVGGGDSTSRLNTSDRESESLEPVVNRAALALSRASMAIYPVDARGVELEPTTSSNERSRTSSQDSAVLTKEQESRDSSKLLADRTGGLAFFGNNDIGDAMRRAMDDGQHGYTIGFYPDHGKWNGKFREVKISVTTKGARLRYRKGYIATAYRVESEKDINAALQETAANPLEATTLGMIVEGKRLEQSSSRNLQLRVGIDPKQLLLQESHTEQKGAVDLLFVQRDSAGKILSAEKQHLELKLPQAQYELLAKAGLVLEHHMSIDLQAAEIRVAVRDAGSGALGSVTFPVQTFFQPEERPSVPARNSN